MVINNKLSFFFQEIASNCTYSEKTAILFILFGKDRSNRKDLVAGQFNFPENLHLSFTISQPCNIFFLLFRTGVRICDSPLTERPSSLEMHGIKCNLRTS